MSNFKRLVDSILQISDPESQNTTYFSTNDLKYAWRQIKLHLDTAKHCYININSRVMTGTSTFKFQFSFNWNRLARQSLFIYLNLVPWKQYISDINTWTTQSQQKLPVYTGLGTTY